MEDPINADVVAVRDVSLTDEDAALKISNKHTLSAKRHYSSHDFMLSEGY